jgi:hypothetical protein
MPLTLTFSRRLGGAALLAGILASTCANAVPPAAPTVTVGADTKQLRFDWEIVPRSNYYELWFKANNGAPYVKFSESLPWRPHAITSVSAHLLDWNQARYQVKACNFSGCGASAPIPVAGYMADTIGYFKASRLHNYGRFGIATAISEDGNTLAAFTAGETSPDYPKAAVYVFAKIDGRWRQQARLIPESSVAPFQNVGLQPGSEAALSLSADGNVLVAAMAFSDRGLDSGGVTIYRRSSGSWTQEHQIIQVQTFGGYVGNLFAEIDQAGEHIVFRPGSYANPTEMIVHGASGWTRQVIQQPPSDLSNGYACMAPRLSGDGEKIAWGCTRLVRLGEKRLFISRPPGWQLAESVPLTFPEGHLLSRMAIDHDGDTIAVGSAVSSTPNGDPRNHVRVLREQAGSPATWETSAPILPGTWVGDAPNQFGTDLALSDDGKLLAILDPRDPGAGVGVLSPPLQAGTEPTGATYIYELRAQGPWLRRVLKPNNPIPAGGLQGGQVRFANKGKTLIVSEPDEPGNSSGIDGDRLLGGRPSTGALWLY